MPVSHYQIPKNSQKQSDDDDVWSTKTTAKYMKCSEQWLEIGRCKGYGPKFIRISKRMIRYRKDDVLQYLEERCYSSTSEADSKEVRNV